MDETCRHRDGRRRLDRCRRRLCLGRLGDRLDLDGDGMISFREFNRILRKVSEDEVKEAELDEFGREVKATWRPKSPVVAVVDVALLRRNVKTEHRLRGLDKCKLNDRPF